MADHTIHRQLIEVRGRISELSEGPVHNAAPHSSRALGRGRAQGPTLLSAIVGRRYCSPAAKTAQPAVMSELKEILLNENTRPQLVNDCVQLIDEEVRQRSGLSGIAIKGGYKIVCKVKPGIIRSAVDHLIDEFVEQLSPFYSRFSTDGGAGDFSGYLTARKSEVASALLGVTDRRIGGARNAGVRKAYEKLRSMAQKQVETAVPGVGRVMGRRIPS